VADLVTEALEGRSAVQGGPGNRAEI